MMDEEPGMDDVENFAASEFRRGGERVLAALERAGREPERWPTLAWSERTSARLAAPAPLPEHGRPLPELLDETSATVLEGYCNVSHPLYFGYISPRPHPAAVLGDLLAGGLNQTPGAWRAGPSATAIEIETLAWLCQLLGYPQADDGLPNGVFTGGGTIANLIGLKLARDRLRERGVALQDMRVYMSVEGHFSVAKALDVLALERSALRSIPADEHGRLCLPALEAALAEDRAAGKRAMALIGVCGTSATGAVDPLHGIADLAERYGAWFHADGAAGAVYAALEETAGLFAGMERADSLTLDPCKWMFVPFGMGCLLVKQGRWLRESFWSSGHYWEELDELDTFKMNLYGTRQWRSLGLWTLLSHLGRQGYLQLLRGMRAAARALAGAIAQDPRYALLSMPELPVLALRPRADDIPAGSALARAVQRRLAAEGRAYPTLLDWGGIDHLRVAVNNYATTVDDMRRFKLMLDAALAAESAAAALAGAAPAGAAAAAVRA